MSNNDNNNSNNNNNSPRRTSSTRSPSRSRSRSPSASRSPSPSPSTSIRKTDDNDKPTTTTTSSNNNNNNDNNNNDDHAKVEQQQQRRRRTPSPLVSSDGDRRDNNDKKKRSSNRRSTKRSRSRSRSRSVSSASSSASDYSSSSSSSSESDSDRRRGRRRRRGSRCEDRRRRSSSVSTSASSSASDSDSGRSRSRSRGNKEATATSMMDAGSDKKTMSDDQFFATLQNKPSAADLAAKNAEANAPTAMDVAKKFRTGGVYIPPFKMRRLQAQITDKSSTEYQRLTWEALKKSINGLINKVNVANIKNLIPEIFSENLVRGRGLFCRAIMKAQAASPGFTHVYAALVAVINTKMPELGELLVKRIVVAFRRSYQRNDKQACLTLTRFIAHLLNQKVVHEILALQLLNLLLGKPTDDSVELAVAFIKECGYVLNDMSPKNLHAVFERFRGILHEGEIDKRVQYMIEGLFAIRKRQFADYVGVPPELDLVEEEDQIMHDVELDQEDLDPETNLDYFHNDPDYERHEQEYQQIKREILGESSSEEEEEGAEAEEGAAGGSESESEEEEEGNNKQQQQQQQQQQQGGAPHKDLSEQELVTFRRNIYLTIMSSLNFEECAHKLLKYQMKPGLEMELCQMLIDCCSQERTYIRYYGLLGQRFCQLNNQREYQKLFEECFRMQYGMIHRLETNKLRNVAKFFAHLLYTDAIDWSVLECIHLNEEETTSSSRIFVKILFQELAELMGLANLNKRLKDPYLAQHFVGLFPKDIPKNTRFAINFFTSIGLGALTDELREHLKNAPKLIMQQKLKEAELLKKHGGLSSSSSSSDSDTDSSSSSSSDSDSDSSSSDSD